MSKSDDIWRYQQVNEERLLAMTGHEKLAEVCSLRKLQRELKSEQLEAKLKLEATQAYRDMQEAKDQVRLTEIAIEGTLRMIEATQRPLSMGVTVPADKAVELLDDEIEKLKKGGVTGVSLSATGPNGYHREVKMGECEDAPEDAGQELTQNTAFSSPNGDAETVNTVTGEVVSAPAAMQQRVFNEHDPASDENGKVVKPLFAEWQTQRTALTRTEPQTPAVLDGSGQGEVVVR